MTDAEGILGIGDWGTNGWTSPIEVRINGLYRAARNRPASVLPLVIDAGTNRQSLLRSPNYLEIVMNVCVVTVIPLSRPIR